MKWIWCCSVGLLIAGLLRAQPSARFIQSEAKVGEHISLVVSLEHDGSKQWIFPDSTWDFTPFEWVSKQIFPTSQLSDGRYLDSVVYVLRTFELDTVLALRTAVVDFPSDSIFFVSNSVSIVSGNFPAPKDSPVYINTLPFSLSYLINYKALFLFGLAFIALFSIVWVLFGKRIKLFFKLRRLEKERIKFLYRFDTLLSENPSKQLAQQVGGLWKHYCQSLSGLPLSSFTSRETAEALQQLPWSLSRQEVYEPLQEIDLAIYAGKISDSFKDKIKSLRSSALQVYEVRINQIKIAR